MIHAYFDDMQHVARINGAAVEGRAGHLKQVSDAGQDFLMMLIPIPGGKGGKLINELIHKR